LPKLLLSRDGPLVIRPSYLPGMLAWTRHALAVLRPDAQRVITDTLAGMTSMAYAALSELAAHAGASQLLSRDGGLVAFKTEAALEKKCRSLPLWNGHGLVAQRLSGSEIRSMEPALARDIVGGLYFQNSGRCSNPRGLGLRYAEHFRRHGGTLLRAEVRTISSTPVGAVTLSTTSGMLGFQRVVLCAGFWSGALMRALGHRAPMVSERGYHLMLPKAGVSLTRPVVFGEPHFAATPMDEGLRLAGTAEFASPDAAPDLRRAHMLLPLAQQYLASLDGEGAKPWMGIRPSLPDGLPAIGVAPGNPGLLYAFGHGHNGLTLSAVTARCIAALVKGDRPPIDTSPLDLRRFAGGAATRGRTTASVPLHPTR